VGGGPRAPPPPHAHQRLCRDGRGARTVTVKLKKSDMSTLTRSATLPYATTDGAALAALARRLLLDPRQIGPIRLLGVGFSGLSNVRQDSLFPDLELTMSGADEEADSAHAERDNAAAATADTAGWRIGDDVTHRDLGHGWVQGAGHGVFTVRFETRGSGPGAARTFAADADEITRANPIDSLDWPEYVAELAEAASAQPVDDVAQR
jgi:DNA polymerase-4